MKQRRISTGQMEAVLFRPEDGAANKAIILLGGSKGGLFSDNYLKFVETFVANGYAVFDLAYFNAGSLPHRLRRIPLEYFENALEWLSKQQDVITGKYAVVGVSKGGELALVLASRYSEFKAVSAVVPANVVFQGMGLPHWAGSSWTYYGEDLPYIPFAWAPWLVTGGIGAITMRFRYLYNASLMRAKGGGKAEIPVERIAGPVQLVSATKDGVWPSSEMCSRIMERLTSNGFQYHMEHVTIDSQHWVLANKECRRSIMDFLASHFPPNSR